MNISTYEARIAALEAQLGPGPSGGTGVLSAVVTPDLTLNEGGTINEKFSALMPITEDLGSEEYGNPSLTVGDTFTIRVTPSEKCYVYNIGEEGPVAVGDIGEAVDIQAKVVEGSRDIYVMFHALVALTAELDDDTPIIGTTLRVSAPKQ